MPSKLSAADRLEQAILAAFDFITYYGAEAEVEIQHTADRSEGRRGYKQQREYLADVMQVLPEVRAAMKRITARKFGGDDRYSWAVFLDGRTAYTGLGLSSVRYYRKLTMLVAIRRSQITLTK